MTGEISRWGKSRGKKLVRKKAGGEKSRYSQKIDDVFAFLKAIKLKSSIKVYSTVGSSDFFIKLFYKYAFACHVYNILEASYLHQL